MIIQDFILRHLQDFIQRFHIPTILVLSSKNPYQD